MSSAVSGPRAVCHSGTEAVPESRAGRWESDPMRRSVRSQMSKKQDAPLITTSPAEEEPPDQADKITEKSQGSSILKSSEVLVNTQCLLKLFRCCSVCLVECCISVEGNERLFSVTQDCQSCGHTSVWRSHPPIAEEPRDTIHTEHKQHKENLHEANKDHEGHLLEEQKDATLSPMEENTEESEDEDSEENMTLMPHRTKNKEVSMETKVAILSLRKQKKSYREIAKTLGLSKSTVGYIVKKAASTGDMSNRKRCGRPRKTTVEDDQIILSIMTKNPQTPIQQIRKTLKQVGRDVSARTIRRKLHALNHTIETTFLHNLKMTK